MAECTRDVGVYRFLVHIYHDSGFYLPVRLTESEASRFMTVTKVIHASISIPLLAN